MTDDPTTREAVERVRGDDPAVAELTRWCDTVRDVVEIARAHARANGYALAVHGSLRRDLDAVAVPWTDDAVDADALVTAITERLIAADLAYGAVLPATDKPHGRQSVVIQLKGEGPPYLDLSIAPKADNLFATDANEILRRVFDDEDIVERFYAWHKPDQWLTQYRALGAFIRSVRVALSDAATTAERERLRRIVAGMAKNEQWGDSVTVLKSQVYNTALADVTRALDTDTEGTNG